MKKIFLLLILFCAACSATVKVSSQTVPQVLALAPIQVAADIPRERALLIRKAISQSLLSRGFLVLDDAAVEEVCGDLWYTPKNVNHKPSCWASLSTLPQAQGKVLANLSTAGKTSLFAGYYSIIKGDIQIVDASDREVATSRFQDYETGGLLFRTGQLIDGFQEQADNGVTSFSRLSYRFADELVRDLPKPTVTSQSVADVSIKNISTKEVTPGILEICATSNAPLYLVTETSRSRMRGTEGARCTTTLRAAITSQAKLEARGALGGKITVPLASQLTSDCLKLTGVTSSPHSEGLLVQATCSDSCNKAASESSCRLNRLILYSAESPEGPFKKIASADKAENISSKQQKNGYYSLAAIGADSQASVPVLIEPTTK